MKTLFVFLPIRDYIKTRRKPWRQYFIPLADGIFVLVGAFAIGVRDSVDIEAVFSDFVGIQINAVATLVSSDNENIRKLKREKSSEIFLMHILLGMMECVTQMYLTFWKDKR